MINTSNDYEYNHGTGGSFQDNSLNPNNNQYVLDFKLEESQEHVPNFQQPENQNYLPQQQQQNISVHSSSIHNSSIHNSSIHNSSLQNNSGFNSNFNIDNQFQSNTFDTQINPNFQPYQQQQQPEYQQQQNNMFYQQQQQQQQLQFQQQQVGLKQIQSQNEKILQQEIMQNIKIEKDEQQSNCIQNQQPKSTTKRIKKSTNQAKNSHMNNCSYCEQHNIQRLQDCPEYVKQLQIIRKENAQRARDNKKMKDKQLQSELQLQTSLTMRLINTLKEYKFKTEQYFQQDFIAMNDDPLRDMILQLNFESEKLIEQLQIINSNKSTLQEYTDGSSCNQYTESDQTSSEQTQTHKSTNKLKSTKDKQINKKKKIKINNGNQMSNGFKLMNSMFLITFIICCVNFGGFISFGDESGTKKTTTGSTTQKQNENIFDNTEKQKTISTMGGEEIAYTDKDNDHDQHTLFGDNNKDDNQYTIEQQSRQNGNPFETSQFESQSYISESEVEDDTQNESDAEYENLGEQILYDFIQSLRIIKKNIDYDNIDQIESELLNNQKTYQKLQQENKHLNYILNLYDTLVNTLLINNEQYYNKEKQIFAQLYKDSSIDFTQYEDLMDKVDEYQKSIQFLINQFNEDAENSQDFEIFTSQDNKDGGKEKSLNTQTNNDKDDSKDRQIFQDDNQKSNHFSHNDQSNDKHI